MHSIEHWACPVLLPEPKARASLENLICASTELGTREQCLSLSWWRLEVGFWLENHWHIHFGHALFTSDFSIIWETVCAALERARAAIALFITLPLVCDLKSIILLFWASVSSSIKENSHFYPQNLLSELNEIMYETAQKTSTNSKYIPKYRNRVLCNPVLLYILRKTQILSF